MVDQLPVSEETCGCVGTYHKMHWRSHSSPHLTTVTALCQLLVWCPFEHCVVYTIHFKSSMGLDLLGKEKQHIHLSKLGLGAETSSVKSGHYSWLKFLMVPMHDEWFRHGWSFSWYPWFRHEANDQGTVLQQRPGPWNLTYLTTTNFSA